MKTTTLLLGLATCFFSSSYGQDRPDIIIQYKDITDIELKLIGNTGNTIIDPTDLEFHPDLSKNELWVVNKGSEAAGGHTVIFSNTGEDTQTSISKADEFNEIYMSRVTGIAFSSNENFATSSGTWDEHHDGGDPFTGPTLWSSDLTVYGEPGMGDGSHIDDLHQSPYGQGIAWDSLNVFWVFDGYMGELVRYDFMADHGPGGYGSSDGVVHRYGGLGLQRDTNDVVVSHLAIDHNSKWLYAVDNGNKRVIRLDITSGTIGGTPFFGPFEMLAEYKYIVDFDWEVVVEDSLVEPSGIAIVGNKMLVADHSNGDIIVYTTEGSTAFDEWFRIKTDDPGIQGIEIGPDGRIYYTNEYNNKVRRIDSPSLSLPDYPKKPAFSVTLYPNPSVDFVTVSSNSDLSQAKIELITQDGKLLEVPTELISDDRAHIDASNLESGVYFVRISTETGITSQRLILK